MNKAKFSMTFLSALLIAILVMGCSPKLPVSSYLPEVPRIGIEDVKTKLEAGTNIVIIDTRPETSYKKSHISGAISLQEETIAESYSDFNGYDEIIIYCN